MTMARLLRPHIPLEVRCRVLLRQLGTMPFAVEASIAGVTRKQSLQVGLAKSFSAQIGCEVADLRLDHDPPLGLRRKVFRKGVHVGYVPAANDPEFLFYRPHGAQFDNSHDVKTRIRGDHGQFSDVVLMKRERRRAKKASLQKVKIATKAKKPRKTSTVGRLKCGVGSGQKSKVLEPRRWASRPFPKGRKMGKRNA